MNPANAYVEEANAMPSINQRWFYTYYYAYSPQLLYPCTVIILYEHNLYNATQPLSRKFCCGLSFVKINYVFYLRKWRLEWIINCYVL